MTVVFYHRRSDGNFEEIGRVRDGEVVEGAENLEGVVLDAELDDEAGLLRRYDGPVLIAREADDE